MALGLGGERVPAITLAHGDLAHGDPFWVKTGKTQNEQMLSGPLITR